MRRVITIIYSFLTAVLVGACGNFLDVVPDNVATLENAFTMRNTAERYLFTCYSYMPTHGTYEAHPGLAAGDETWLPVNIVDDNPVHNIARGQQRVLDPYMNFWEGRQGATDLYGGIRDCNIFLENVGNVPDLEEFERDRWISEVKFLKAYYHYYLLRLYGPIPLIKENLPISAGVKEVQVERAPVDECVDYIIELLDESLQYLPDRIENEVLELGRITKSINLALKAEVLMHAASPLFNGNPDYEGFANKDGTALFSTDVDLQKWQRAADACKKAILFAESLGYKLYEYEPRFSQYDLSDETLIHMSIRNAVCEPWNPEIIWGDINSRANAIQNRSAPRGLDPMYIGGGMAGNIGIPLKIAELFYSANGVPIEEDLTWDYANRFDLQTAGDEHRHHIKPGYTTSAFNFDRENRFYADLGFDGGIWYGQGKYDDSGDLLFMSSKRGDPAWMYSNTNYTVSGYLPKKLYHFQNVMTTSLTKQLYPWPVIRLASLYLYYAEALNEAEGPQAEVFEYLNRVRERAGLPTVQDAWSSYSKFPEKIDTRDGLREIIQRERLIEMAFESHRFYDLRRWKRALTEMNKPITGWDIWQSEEPLYYRETQLYKQSFTTRDYLWPINESEILRNPALVQNPGW